MTDDIRDFAMKVITAAATECGVSVKRVMAKGRKKEVIMARYLAYKIIYERTSHIKRDDTNKAVSTTILGEFFGAFDHATVVYALKVARIALGEDPQVKADATWKKAYDNILERIAPALEIEVIANGVFFPYTHEGYLKARNFLWDLGEYELREGRHDAVIRHANRIINRYKVC